MIGNNVPDKVATSRPTGTGSVDVPVTDCLHALLLHAPFARCRAEGALTLTLFSLEVNKT